MIVEIAKEAHIILKEVYNSIEFQTETGEKLFVCMRDDGFEIGSVRNSHPRGTRWYQVKDGNITSMEGGVTSNKDKD
jgi:hypothetical protein